MMLDQDSRELEAFGEYRYDDGENGPARPCQIPPDLKGENLDAIAAQLKSLGKSKAVIEKNGNTYEVTISALGGWVINGGSNWRFV
jgi:hypothetical protein